MPIWSHSRLQSFQQCPRKYAFRYLEKPDVDAPDSIEAFLGSRVHDVLEQLYRDVRMTKVPSEEELLAEYDKVWNRHVHDGLRIVRRRYTAEHYYRVGRQCLQDYYRRHHPFRQGRTLGLEERIVIDLDPRGEVRLQGYIDRLTQTADGHYEIHDYKTSNSLPAQEHFDLDRQLALYQIGIERRFRDARRVDLVWHYLQFDREIRSRREPSELEQLRFDTLSTIQEVETQTRKGEFPTRESMLCDWCEYASVCPAKKHLYSLSEATPEEFRQDDGVQLVDAWMRAYLARQEATRDAEAELDGLKERIARFASEHGLEVIVGTEHKLRVKKLAGLKVPVRADDPASYQALLELLQTLNLWPRVSTLDRHAVLRLLDEEGVEADVRKRIAERLVPEDGVRITPSRLSERERLLEP